MAKLHYLPIRIHKFFPPDSELAVKVAKMCVLVEGFCLECQGFTTNQIEILDCSVSEQVGQKMGDC